MCSGGCGLRIRIEGDEDLVLRGLAQPRTNIEALDHVNYRAASGDKKTVVFPGQVCIAEKGWSCTEAEREWHVGDGEPVVGEQGGTSRYCVCSLA